jgi:hypothetical protein
VKIRHADGTEEEFATRGEDPPIIIDPGKFEAEPIHVPYFWQIGLSGFADRDDGKTYGFDLTREDKERFPWLKRRRTVNLIETDRGFVGER